MTSKLLLGDYKKWIGELEYDYLFTSPPDFEEIGIDPSKPDLYQDFLIEVFSASTQKVMRLLLPLPTENTMVLLFPNLVL